MVKPTPLEIKAESKLNRTPEGWKAPKEPPFTHVFNPVLVSAGTVCGIGRSDSVTLVRHRKAVMWVHWYANALPPGVKMGARVAFVGKLRTFNLGHHLQVVDAMLLKKSPKSILLALIQTLPGLIVDPKEYLSESDLTQLDL